jgi:uncharacterized membrane protein
MHSSPPVVFLGATIKTQGEHPMSTIEKSITVKVPVRTAYNQWTQFEEFPLFMDGVISVQQMGDRRLHWRTKISGHEKEFDTEITEQLPDERIAWRSRSGPNHGGVVTFHRIDDRTTRVMLQMEYEPEGLLEKAGDWLGVTSSRVYGDLERFKDYIESRGRESGAWRGQINRPS